MRKARAPRRRRPAIDNGTRCSRDDTLPSPSAIEEEYQTVDPVTFDLRSHIQTEIVEKGKRQLNER